MFSITVLLVLISIVNILKIRKPIKVSMFIASILCTIWALTYCLNYLIDDMSFISMFLKISTIYSGWPLSQLVLSNITVGDNIPLLFAICAVCGIIQYSILGYVVALVLVKTKVWKV
jgi:hypothetical protein